MQKGTPLAARMRARGSGLNKKPEAPEIIEIRPTVSAASPSDLCRLSAAIPARARLAAGGSGQAFGRRRAKRAVHLRLAKPLASARPARLYCLQRSGHVMEGLRETVWTAGDLLERLERRKKFFVLDVRNRDEFERFRLEGRGPLPAVNVPYFEMLELGGKDEMVDSVRSEERRV